VRIEVRLFSQMRKEAFFPQLRETVAVAKLRKLTDQRAAMLSFFGAF